MAQPNTTATVAALRHASGTRSRALLTARAVLDQLASATPPAAMAEQHRVAVQDWSAVLHLLTEHQAAERTAERQRVLEELAKQ